MDVSSPKKWVKKNNRNLKNASDIQGIIVKQDKRNSADRQSEEEQASLQMVDIQVQSDEQPLEEDKQKEENYSHGKQEEASLEDVQVDTGNV